MRIALAQINPTVWDFAGNIRKIRDWASMAQQQGADLVVFSELCLCGYPPQDLAERPGFWADNLKALRRLAGELPPIPTVVGFVARSDHEHGKPAQNRAALLDGGKVAFEQTKMLLPTYDVFDETRCFEPATCQEIYNLRDTRVALTICEDAWNDKEFWQPQLYHRDPIEELVGKGMDLLINISASPFSQGKRSLRRTMFKALARRHRIPIVAVNQVGGNDDLIFDGSSLALNAKGEVRAEAASFSEDMVFFDTATGAGDIHTQPEEGIVEIYSALTFGLREYVRKCGFTKVVVGLSGGIDSSVVAALAVAALGPDNVVGVAMPGPFSSRGSLNDAKKLAGNLGIAFHILPVKEPFDAYLRVLRPLFDGREEDATEENLQARVRGNYLMAYSNKFNALMLSTGNKSELAVGYCTLYGDLAGGLAVLSDVPKTMVYELARYLNRHTERIVPQILNKPPSAELRPNQTDQDSLPPYNVLDSILRLYIEDHKTADEIAGQEGLDLALVKDIVRRVQQNEYKRRQAPPGLKVTSKAFGPGRRYPIAMRYTLP